MSKDIKYVCNGCKKSWVDSDYKGDESGSDFRDGYLCPNCGSKDISGFDEIRCPRADCGEKLFDGELSDHIEQAHNSDGT